jgi:serine phosphatase RsbU (regulator of sigma subunit)
MARFKTSGDCTMGWVQRLRSSVSLLQEGVLSRRSIGRRLLWSYLVSSTLPLLLVGTLLIALGFRTQRDNVYDNQVTQVVGMAREISAYLSGFDVQILRLSSDLQPNLPEPELSAVVGDLFRANSPNLQALAVIDQDGREVLDQASDGSAVRLRPRDVRADAAFQAALGGRGQRGIVRNSDGSASFTLLLPIRNANSASVVGVVSAEISAVPVEQAMRSVRGAGNHLAYLVDENQKLVLSASPDMLLAPRELQLLFREPSDVTEYVGSRGQPVVGAYAPLRPTSWSVVLERPSAEAFAASRRSGLILALLVGVVGLLALAAALWQARRIIRPLRRLGAGANALGSGQLEHRIAAEGDDELSDVAQTFNQMAEHLQLSRSEIEQQNERLRNGLVLARDIQVGLLPTAAPWSADTLSVYARSLPAYEVGGDFYSYMALPHGRAAIAIGDISGKGVGAALLMALTSSLVESHARQSESPAQVLQALNSALTPRMKANRMNAALLYAVLDPSSRQLTVANAGMIAPLLLGSQGVRMLDIGGLPIGSFAGAIYREHTLTLDAGETLLFVSDGVVEAHNAQSELWGFERLEALLQHLEGAGDTRQIVTAILDAVHVWMGDAEQHDDITVVAVHPAQQGGFEHQGQELELEVHAT